MNRTILFFLFVTTLLGAPFVYADDEDLRSYQHGIDMVSFPDNSLSLVWSSGGNPPSGEWTHDVYISAINRSNPLIKPKTLLSRDEAQEPASAAVNTKGNIMVTMEDGWNAKNEVAQRFGVYDSALNPVRAYPQLVLDGGHSGHVTSVGENFVIFYSEGWVDGGGVDDLGSGDDVYAAIYSSDGVLQKEADVAVSSTRDWWPLVAGSPSRALLVWQRFVQNETHANLMFALLNPSTGQLVKSPLKLVEGVTYYTYSVAYLPTIERFLVLGTFTNGRGFGYLIDNDGNIVTKNINLPPIVREAQSVIRNESNQATVVQARAPSGVMVLTVTNNKITLREVRDDTYQWQYMGVDGAFLDATHVYLVALSTHGLIERTYILDAPTTGITETPKDEITPRKQDDISVTENTNSDTMKSSIISTNDVSQTSLSCEPEQMERALSFISHLFAPLYIFPSVRHCFNTTWFQCIEGSNNK
jgi:hypothetical protein